MGVPTTYTSPTGFNNAVTSFNKWLATNVPPASAADFIYDFLGQMDSTVFPRVAVTPMDNTEPGISAMDQQLLAAGSQTKGRPNELIFEINIYDDVKANAAAKKHVFQVRDRILRGLANAGISNDADVEIQPPIKVLDYDNAGADTGIVLQVLIEQQAGITGRYFPPGAEAPGIHRLQLLVRTKWHELI